jgi:hypothetical protein
MGPMVCRSRGQIKKAPLVPWATVPWNELRKGGTGPPTFDFQSRPDVGRLLRRGAPCFLLRFKDSFQHEHKQG